MLMLVFFSLPGTMLHSSNALAVVRMLYQPSTSKTWQRKSKRTVLNKCINCSFVMLKLLTLVYYIYMTVSYRTLPTVDRKCVTWLPRMTHKPHWRKLSRYICHLLSSCSDFYQPKTLSFNMHGYYLFVLNKNGFYLLPVMNLFWTYRLSVIS